jgi:hypothetical protein
MDRAGEKCVCIDIGAHEEGLNTEVDIRCQGWLRCTFSRVFEALGGSFFLETSRGQGVPTIHKEE